MLLHLCWLGRVCPRQACFVTKSYLIDAGGKGTGPGLPGDPGAYHTMQFMVLHLLIPAGLAGDFGVHPTAPSQPSASSGHLPGPSHAAVNAKPFLHYLPATQSAWAVVGWN